MMYLLCGHLFFTARRKNELQKPCTLQFHLRCSVHVTFQKEFINIASFSSSVMKLSRVRQINGYQNFSVVKLKQIFLQLSFIIEI